MKKAVFLFLILLSACSSPMKKKNYMIGIDSSWYPMDLEGQESQVLGFSLDLLSEIAMEQDLNLERIDENALALIPSLNRERFQGVLTVMQPQIFLEDKYVFSNLYLVTGPSLVVHKNSLIDDLGELSGKEIAVMEGSNDSLLLRESEGVIIRSYDQVAQVLLAIANGEIDGAIVDFLIAERYIRDLYREQLMLATPPLEKRGLRLIALRGKEGEFLVKQFDRGLKALHKNSDYKKLLEKWSLPAPK